MMQCPFAMPIVSTSMWLQVHERPYLPVFQEPFFRNSRLAYTRNGYQLFHSNDVCDGLRSQRSLVARVQ